MHLFFFSLSLQSFPQEMNLRKEKKKNHRSRSTQNQKSRSNIERITKNLNPKKKKKKITNSNSDPLLTKLNKSPYQSPNLHMHIHTQREREKDRVYEMNRCFDVLDKSWATLIISWFMAMVSPNVIPLHSAKPSISITITISMPIHLSSLFSLSLSLSSAQLFSLKPPYHEPSLSLTHSTENPNSDHRPTTSLSPIRPKPSFELQKSVCVCVCVCVWESHRHSRPTSKPLYYYLWIKIKY